MKISKKILKNEKGQMAIFVALVFQVLFVLFAMSINVGLVVYDKVNLQNSVDLAAYYGAQKQAEMLNVMAHQNYQIRQAWKLLSWRYRVLGQYGLGSNRLSSYTHPGRPNQNSSLFYEQETAYNAKANRDNDGEFPVICVGYAGAMWSPSYTDTNLCRERNLKIRNVERALQTQHYGLFTGAAVTQSVIRATQNTAGRIRRNCQKSVAFNYLYGAGITLMYKLEQKARKDIIYSLFYNMKGESGDFVDLNGGSVREGVVKMVNKNLTFGNKEFGNARVEYYNSVARSDLTESEFFNDVIVEPTILYTDASDASDSRSLCGARPKPIWKRPTYPGAKEITDPVNQQTGGYLYNLTENPADPNNKYQFSLGLEKNPWAWIYSGVRAEVQTRPLFFPFGEPLTLQAVAFAKPFGGRMGPWYKSGWSSKSNFSNTGTETDALIPFKREEINAGEGDNLELEKRYFPNYSRFPGDDLGLGSKFAMAAMKDLNRMRGLSPADHVSAGLSWLSEYDAIVWDTQNDNPDFKAREIEIAAIAPDLFDATYYSIEPRFSKVYQQKLEANKGVILKPGPKVESVNEIVILGDIGSRRSHPDGEKRNIDVIDQINIYNKNNKVDQAYYFLNDPKHLLTSWLHPLEYLDFSAENYKKKFAKCKIIDDTDNEFSIPGGCKSDGGRIGYSVKLISANLLFRNDLALGGEADQVDEIRNKPVGFFSPR